MYNVHVLSNDLTCNSSTFIQVRIPELDRSLSLKPSQTHKQGKYDATTKFVGPSLLGSLNDILCDDPAVRVGKVILLELTGDHLFDLVLQPQCNLGDFL